MSKREATNRSGIVFKDDHGSNAALSALTKEARDHLEPRQVDWERLESGLFARVEREAAHEKERQRFAGSRVWLVAPVVGAIAAAAALVLVMGRPSEVRDEVPVATTEPPPASVLASAEGGDLLVDGRPARPGGTITTGSTVLAQDGAATFERKGEVTWTLEQGSSATVTRAHPLVLALIEGAIEAQVEPVPNGEAFAVDVGPTRVAVHGTHLRVARQGENVTVDLSEGVVSIGTPPKSGSTLGELVTAPAHVELTAADAKGTLRIDHTPTAVRAPVVLVRSTPAPAHPLAGHPPASPPAAGGAPAPGAKSEPAAPHASVASTTPSTPDPHAEGTIANAVRGCLAERPKTEGVSITVASVLELKLNEDGAVQAARFTPALPAEVQECAAASIYKTRFTRAGTVSIPIEFKQ